MRSETALQLIDMRHALAGALENQYFAQIHQGTETNSPDQGDLFKTDPDPVDFDDPLPDF